MYRFSLFAVHLPSLERVAKLHDTCGPLVKTRHAVAARSEEASPFTTGKQSTSYNVKLKKQGAVCV